MLRRVRIQGYKSLRDVEVHLRPLTVLCGPNAAGKSNFLDALQLLSRLSTSRSLKEAFEAPYRGTPLESFAFGEGGMEGLLERDSAQFSMEADFEVSDAAASLVEQEIREVRTSNGAERHVPERFLQYRVTIEVFPKTGTLRLADEYLAPLRADGTPKRSRKPFLERVDRKIRLRMERQSHPMEFETGLDHTVLSRPLHPPHYPHLLAARHELANWHFFYFEPRERMRVASPVHEVRHLGLMGDEMAAFLNTMKAGRPKQLEALERALGELVPQVDGIDVSVNRFGEAELSLREGTVLVPARLLSEGTLRVLGLLAAAASADAPGLIGLEEPEIGIHPRRIELIAEFLKTRARAGRTQLVVTTHSPTLLDLLPTASLFVAARRAGETKIMPISAWNTLARGTELQRALADPDGQGLSPSRRLMSGEFDG